MGCGAYVGPCSHLQGVSRVGLNIAPEVSKGREHFSLLLFCLGILWKECGIMQVQWRIICGGVVGKGEGGLGLISGSRNG